MSIEEYEEEEAKCIEQNAWHVAKVLKDRVFMEPGPAGDLMFSHVTDKNPFFHNAKHLKRWLNTTSSQALGVTWWSLFCQN